MVKKLIISLLLAASLSGLTAFAATTGLDSGNYTTEGTWSNSVYSGYGNKSFLETSEQNANIKWNVSGTPLKYYRVWYWNCPLENGDPEAEIVCRNYKMEFRQNADMTEGTAGFKELGVFQSFSETSTVGYLEISFVCSGKGVLGSCAVKTEEVSEEEYKFSKLFISDIPDAVIMKNGSDKYFKKIMEYTMDTEPCIINDRTMVPLRTVSELLGAEVEWNESEHKAIIKKDGDSFEFFPDSKMYIKNGTQYESDAEAVMRNDRILVPLRIISEGMKMTVHWDNENQLIFIAPSIKEEFLTSDVIEAVNSEFLK